MEDYVWLHLEMGHIMLKWLNNSNLKVSIDLNPFVWVWLPKGIHQGPTESDPKLNIWYVRWLFLSVNLVLDNGDWVAWEELVQVKSQTGGDLL